ncbi:hypothetical protein [Paraburkholderia saeva]|uniref:hypothetical protein n=1 Tax=Paraburkholderia saeva TaxID=2777537 RepID=UPI001E4ACCDC|nr:hypothetical protein [Paraburkholderia saeva]
MAVKRPERDGNTDFCAACFERCGERRVIRIALLRAAVERVVIVVVELRIHAQPFPPDTGQRGACIRSFRRAVMGIYNLIRIARLFNRPISSALLGQNK